MPGILLDRKKLKALREKEGLTLEQVSKALGYKSPVGYYYIESGKSRLRAEHAAALAQLFGVKLEELFLSPMVTESESEQAAAAGG